MFLLFDGASSEYDGAWVSAADDWAFEDSDDATAAGSAVATATASDGAADASAAAAGATAAAASSVADAARGGPSGRVAGGGWAEGVTYLVAQIFRSRYTGDAEELLVRWKGLAHMHSQWVPRAALEAQAG